jgi:hypothetical protein
MAVHGHMSTWKIVMSSRARMTSKPPGMTAATGEPPAIPVENRGVGVTEQDCRNTYSVLYPINSESVLVQTMLHTACANGTSRLSSKVAAAEFQTKICSLYLLPTRQQTASEHDSCPCELPPTAMVRG